MGGFYVKKLFKLINAILIIISLFLAYNIFIKKDMDFSFLKNLYSTMTNHININKYNQTVSTINYYKKVAEYTYTNESYSVCCPYNGTIIKQNDSEIVIKCDNGYYAYYSSLINIVVRKNDVITSQDELANFIDTFNFYFKKGEQVYSYEEIVTNN